MRTGLYAAVSGLEQAQRRQTAIAYNLANASTPGFKAKKVISSSFRATLERGEPRTHYVRTNEVTDFSQGNLELTDRRLDVALNGKGFFAVQTQQGTRYTRDGSFHVDATGQLVTKSGDPVLGEGNQPLRVADSDGLSINEAGQIVLNGEPRGQLQIVDFDEPYPLTSMGGGLFYAEEGARPKPSVASVTQGALEGSNAPAIDMLVQMIENLRAFEANQKSIQSIDRTLQRAVASSS
ncbi:MAG: flagellar basal-body rod protein FlgF [Planctomycetota bacterium]